MLLLQPYEVTIWGADKNRPLYKSGVQAFSEDEAKESAMQQFRVSHCSNDLAVGRSWSPIPLPKVERVEVLSGVHLNPKKRQQSLFEELAERCVGSELSDVQGACVNLLLTSVHKRYAVLTDAEARWDELMGRGKAALQRRFSGQIDERDRSVGSEIGQRLVG